MFGFAPERAAARALILTLAALEPILHDSVANSWTCSATISEDECLLLVWLNLDVCRLIYDEVENIVMQRDDSVLSSILPAKRR